MVIISYSGTQNASTHRRQTANRTTGAHIAAIGSEQNDFAYSTAVSCNISPLAKRAGLSTSMSSTTFVVPRRIKSAKIFPVAGACITPCPLKPLAQYKPVSYTHLRAHETVLD